MTTLAAYQKELEDAVAMFGDKEKPYQNLLKHIRSIIVDRSIIFTADEDHLSGVAAMKLFKKIDNKKKYSWQDDNCNEKEFIERLIGWYLPTIGFELGAKVYMQMTEDNIAEVIAGTKGVKIPINRYAKGCYDCDHPMYISVKGNVVHLGGTEPCTKNRSFSVEIDLPTGEMVFADWPERFAEAKAAGLLVDKDFDINKLLGQRQNTESWAKNNNAFHASVGNSSPTLYVTGKDGTGTKIRIGKGAPGFKDVGSFCTDLWATTIIDKKFYDQLMALLPPVKKPEPVETAKVKPGRYRFTIVDRYTGYDEDADYEATLYSFAERIGDAQAEDIQIQERELMHFDSVIRKLDWRTQNADGTVDLTYARLSMADHIFNVLGNGLNNYGDLMDGYAQDEDTPEPYSEDDDKPSDPPKSINPYPNFQKRYSLLYQNDTTLGKLPDSWLEAAYDYYAYCAEYFRAGAPGYFHKFSDDNEHFNTKKFTETLEKLRTDKMTDEQWHAKVTKDYEFPFHGDVKAFGEARWERDRSNHLAFCEETVALIEKEMDRRLVDIAVSMAEGSGLTREEIEAMLAEQKV
jgi:hypothetical protein